MSIYKERLTELQEEAKCLNWVINGKQSELDEVLREIYDIEHSAEHNVFFDLPTALEVIEDKLHKELNQVPHGEEGDCEYSCDFNVNGQDFTGTLYVEWNRYDKQYYYVDSTDFKYEEKNDE